MSMLTAFNNQLSAFFEELGEVIPEEKDVKMALEAIKGTKRINPRLILDLFYEHIYVDLHTAIQNKDIVRIQTIARMKILNQFNEIMPALTIFDKHWAGLSESSQEALWKYLKVLCILCEKARAST